MFPASLQPSPFIHFLSTRVTRDCEFRCQDLDPKQVCPGHSALSAFVAVVLFCGQAESSFSWEKVTYEKTKSLSSKDLAACYDFLCQTMRNNDDAHFYTQVGIDLGTQPIWVLLLQKP